MRDLLILGTGVHSREMVEIVDRVNAVAPTWRLLGLVAAPADAGAVAGRLLNGAPVLGGPEVITAHPGAGLLPCLPDWPLPDGIEMDRVVSLVDPSCVVSRTARIGRGCVLYPHCFVGLDAVLEDAVFALSGCIINHDDHVGSRTILAAGVRLAGSVTVEPGCSLGQACTVRQLLTIGRESTIGTGAVIIRDVEPHSVMAGNPARLLRRADRPAPK